MTSALATIVASRHAPGQRLHAANESSPAMGSATIAALTPERFEAAGTGGELRPIAEGAFGPLTLGVNPIVGFTFDNGVHADLEPCARALMRLAPWLSAGAEYYSSLGPIDGLLPASEQVHRVFGVVELYSGHLDVNFGIGGGTGDDSFLAKAILTVRP